MSLYLQKRMMHEFNEIFYLDREKRRAEILTKKKNHNFSKLPLLFKKQKYTFQLFSFKYKKKKKNGEFSKYLNHFPKKFVRFSQNYNDRNVLFSRCFLGEEKKKMSKKKHAFRRLNETIGETMVDKLILT